MLERPDLLASACSSPCLVRPHRYAHLADGIDAREHRVAGLHRAHTFRRAGIEYVAGVKRIEGRAPFDQLAAIIDQLFRAAVLLDLAIDENAERNVVGIGNLVGGDEPWPEHGITIDRFAKAAILGTACGHVEADAVADHVIERFFTRDIAAL